MSASESSDVSQPATEEQQPQQPPTHPLLPWAHKKYGKVDLPTPEQLMQEEFMNNCATRTVLAGAMGSLLGVKFGLFMVGGYVPWLLHTLYVLQCRCVILLCEQSHESHFACLVGAGYNGYRSRWSDRGESEPTGCPTVVKVLGRTPLQAPLLTGRLHSGCSLLDSMGYH